ncbi:hypothetical protein GHT06_013457 [Daphnia sinensis]|uniref:Uncharacterized protein n=1 Tax=Daphnia sinensis TaxID=1820382 RepID=A0AAD5LB76_9CRUS|nr:hypothetical protein GHT06_013457 [Daphnia sinensis]
MAYWSEQCRLDTVVKEKLQNRQASQLFNSAVQKKYIALLSVGAPVRILGIVQSICSEPNSYTLCITDCGRLFRRNRQAINVHKSRCRQLLQQEKDVPRPSPHTTAPKFLPVWKSLSFLEEWQSAPRIIVPQPPAIPAIPETSVPENEDPEDFMDVFHGFEELRLGPSVCVLGVALDDLSQLVVPAPPVVSRLKFVRHRPSVPICRQLVRVECMVYFLPSILWCTQGLCSIAQSLSCCL